MFRPVLLIALAALAAAQYNSDPRTAAILSEARYLQADGKFGAQYTQEDGVEFKEESDPDGTRRGSYSYIDPTGQRKTITYTAGKNGFQASGAHLPVGPAPPPQYTPQPQYNPPQPSYQAQYNPPPVAPAQPQYNSIAYQAPAPQYRPQPATYTTTPPPHRFFPPGKLSLNRSPDGFSYTFNKA